LTTNRYPPPAPYVSAEPFQPYQIAAVELAEEKMVVLGQVTTTGELELGAEVELVLDTLYTNEEDEYVVWKWSAV
jgi:uncharacterized OB-fold protein